MGAGLRGGLARRGPGRARRARRGRGGAPARSGGVAAAGYPLIWGLLARGRLRLAQGRFEEAADDLRESARRTLGIGHRTPAIAPWRSLLAEALVGLGERDEARRLVAEELELRASRRRRRARSASRCARWRRVEGGDDESACCARRSPRSTAPQAQLERARAHADLGAALRRAGEPDEAREPLRLAVDLAHRCGAGALEDRALGELRAAGARPRRRATTGAGALTPSERRIAELAASGSQNREIAQALFVTTRHGRVPPAQRVPQARDHRAVGTWRGAGNVNCGWVGKRGCRPGSRSLAP